MRRVAIGMAALAVAAVGAAGSANGAVFHKWTAAANHLTAPVYRPSMVPAGARLLKITTTRLPCGRTVEELIAVYRTLGGGRLRIYEGSPFFCGDLGEVTTLAVTRIGKSRAEIVTSPNGDNPNGIIILWNTDWRAKNQNDSVGTDLAVEIDSRDIPLVTSIARGLRMLPL